MLFFEGTLDFGPVTEVCRTLRNKVKMYITQFKLLGLMNVNLIEIHFIKRPKHGPTNIYELR